MGKRMALEYVTQPAQRWPLSQNVVFGATIVGHLMCGGEQSRADISAGLINSAVK